ncbi:MAG: hypothetical protein WBG41_14620 [Acidimicrobiales bacterium]
MASRLARVIGAVLVLTSAVIVTIVAGTSQTATAAPSTVSAYWLVASDGGIFSLGGAGFYGSMGGHPLNQPIVGMAGTNNSQGYWLDASDGGIFAFGNAGFYGSMGGHPLNAPIVGMAAAPNGGGYWLVASDGGIFAFGDAGFYGSMGGKPLNQPIVGMAPTPNGGGYWLVAADGGIFAFGDAGFYGSMGGQPLNAPIVGMAAAHGGGGYWFVASDGGIFAFGDAAFYGSLGNVPQSRPIVAMASDSSGNGYWFTNNNGAVTPFGGANYWGSAPQVLVEPVVGMAEADANGDFADAPYPAGSLGYDVSNYQCGNYPPEPHVIGIVQVEGASFGATNYCLGGADGEAAWAGAGLNLYIYLTFGTTGSSPDAACNSGAFPYNGSATACNYGFETAVDAFNKATAAGVDTQVSWWLDVEDPSLTVDPAASASMIQGAIDGFRSLGLNNVGIYASPANWPNLVGTSYQPDVPYWVADWGPNPAATCADVHSWYGDLPSGPVQIVQYASTNNTDYDYAC